DFTGIVGVFEEELAVAGQVIHLDVVGGHTGRVDERDDERRPAAREDRVELEPAEERVGNRAEPAHVIDVLGGGGDQRIEALGLEHAGQALSSMCVHGSHLKFGMTSRPKSSIASCISGTVLATKSR